MEGRTSDIACTLVLVGRTGNGKSATANTILGTKKFASRACLAAVTEECQMGTNTRSDGRIVNVIDTPGLFDPKATSEFLAKEIMKCVSLSTDGIHALLFVLSLRNRFTPEEVVGIKTIQHIFGEDILRFMIIVFTGGDEVDEEGLEGYFGATCPKDLKELIGICNNRVIILDNKTNDEAKKFMQLCQLFELVDSVNEENGGKAYTSELLQQVKEKKKDVSELQYEMERSFDDQRTEMAKEMERRTKEIRADYEEKLAYERSLREQVEKVSKLQELLNQTSMAFERRLSLETSQREMAEQRLWDTSHRLERAGYDARVRSVNEVNMLRRRLSEMEAETQRLRRKKKSECVIS